MTEEITAAHPKVFISYSWDDDEHKRWTKEFAARLRHNGVDVTLDRWAAVPGDRLPLFMEQAVRENSFVLIICTPKYKDKSDKRTGGVGYEGDIMTGEVHTEGNHRKFIPILRRGDWQTDTPSWLGGRLGIDLRGDPYSEDSYRDLLDTLHGMREQAPPLGPVPSRQPSISTVNRGHGSSGAELEKPILSAVAQSGVALPATLRRKQVIVLIHGIRTFANWQPMVARVLQEIPDTKVFPIKFGFFNGIMFWCPFLTRAFVIKQVRREIENAQTQHKDTDLSVIAHSFGTFAIIEILKDHPNVVLKQLVFCGSIVKQTFRWEQISSQLKTCVINDYGTRDIWPVLAKCLSWGYGDTGRHSFGRVAVRDRAHDYKHSDFFNEEFVRQYWKPWFEHGQLVPSQWDEKAPTSPYWLSILSILPLQWILLVLLVFGVATLCYRCFHPSPPPQFEGSFVKYLALRNTFQQSGSPGLEPLTK